MSFIYTGEEANNERLRDPPNERLGKEARGKLERLISFCDAQTYFLFSILRRMSGHFPIHLIQSFTGQTHVLRL